MKLFRAPFWEAELSAYVEVFTRRREELNRAIIIHMGIAVESLRGGMEDISNKYIQYPNDVYSDDWC